MKTLTIIVPSYNVEEYLGKTLESFIQPSVLDRLEVIVVDDGSKDKTSEIGQKYHEKYPNSFFVITKENGGHGSTINVGLEKATGKYVKIVDGDDWVHADALIKMVEYLDNCEADAVLTAFETYNMQTQEVIEYKRNDVEFERLYDVEHDPIINCHFALTTVCYRTGFIKGVDFLLQEHTFYVDEEYIGIPLLNIKTWVYLDCCLYVYQIGNVNQSISTQNKLKRIDHIERIITSLMNAYMTTDTDAAHKNPLIERLKALVTGYYLLTLIYFDDRTEGKKLFSAMEKKVSQIPELEIACSKKRKMFCILNSIGINGKIYDKMRNSSMLRNIFSVQKG